MALHFRVVVGSLQPDEVFARPLAPLACTLGRTLGQSVVRSLSSGGCRALRVLCPCAPLLHILVAPPLGGAVVQPRP
eukprot:6456173-Amphidinium_carterae.1